MRVHTGSKGSRRLLTSVPGVTRPTSSRVRKSIFDILWSRFGIEGKTVLDLFAGTGALGIEALSRGAKFAHFVDHSAVAVRVIKQNLSLLEIEESKYAVTKADYRRFLDSYAGDRFDIAFLDPPYVFDRWDELLQMVPATIMVCETGKMLTLPPTVKKLLDRKYGTTVVTLVEAAGSGS